MHELRSLKLPFFGPHLETDKIYHLAMQRESPNEWVLTSVYHELALPLI